MLHCIHLLITHSSNFAHTNIIWSISRFYFKFAVIKLNTLCEWLTNLDGCHHHTTATLWNSVTILALLFFAWQLWPGKICILHPVDEDEINDDKYNLVCKETKSNIIVTAKLNLSCSWLSNNWRHHQPANTILSCCGCSHSQTQRNETLCLSSLERCCFKFAYDLGLKAIQSNDS